MKDINRLSADILNFGDRAIDNIIKAQSDTAEKIWEDVIDLAPYKEGDYISSIQISNTEYDGSKITTSVYTDLKSPDGYLIGRMLENGTGIYALEPHIGHTKTFIESQYKYWYVPATKVDRKIGKEIYIKGQLFYLAKAQPSQPHFLPALNMNRALYVENIRKAVKEAK